MDKGSWALLALTSAGLLSAIAGVYAILAKRWNPEAVIGVTVGSLSLVLAVALPVINPRVSVARTLLSIAGATAAGVLVTLLARVFNRAASRRRSG
ncbi:MAG: hypothetical protein M0Z94_12290 [Dehalococcoidales bacterium]|nr:hypothetical protein [Dehalococcoidales bacterium]